MSIPFCPLQVCDLGGVCVKSLGDGLRADWPLLVASLDPSPLGGPSRSPTMKIDVKETTKPMRTFGDLKTGDVYRHPGEKTLYRKLPRAVREIGVAFVPEVNCVDVETGYLWHTSYDAAVEVAKSVTLAVEF